MYQQGDVLLFPVNKIPVSAKRENRKERGYVLAEGESTGHAHVIDSEIEFYRDGDQLYFRAKSEVIVKHEEHNPVTVPAGTYRIGIVQEYDYDAEAAKNVID